MNSSSVSNTYSASTDKCKTCFFGSMKDSIMAPCKGCSGYSKYVKDSIYFWGEKQLEENHTDNYDVVNKPRHYMLFEDKNIEVRDVIKRLMEKMQDSDSLEFSPIDYSDYFQAMAYFMRFMDKNGKEDLEKGVWYMNKIIDNWKPWLR